MSVEAVKPLFPSVFSISAPGRLSHRRVPWESREDQVDKSTSRPKTAQQPPRELHSNTGWNGGLGLIFESRLSYRAYLKYFQQCERKDSEEN